MDANRGDYLFRILLGKEKLKRSSDSFSVFKRQTGAQVLIIS